MSKHRKSGPSPDRGGRGPRGPNHGPKRDSKRGGGPRAQPPKGAGGNRYWLTGTHPVRAALSNPERACHRLLCTDGARADIEPLARQRGVPLEVTDRQEIDRLAGPDMVHQGLAMEVEPLEPLALQDLPDASPGRPLLVLDQVTDPRNVGAILRSAAVFGAIAVLVQDRHAPPETAALAKAASGALESVPLVRVGNLARALDEVKEAGYWTVGLAGEVDDTLNDVPLDRPVALILGAEGDGMRRLTREGCDQVVRIDMVRNEVGSLNVSNAAAVALYAATRPAQP
ncbi:23S rRNA (guanosine(2251)-2'-O)-methyltransferase RlmB [Rhodospirillaceae bacterium KN72]|uniref:23S rRNA (Guanosine(2251)-2'-O)-methyltransferase RlmB n=1 Tax=Pacificispira spongiicola TaxID=2729598 RepID=A0A7Y0HFL0_9PROT|nr:23S rRNA (guanosine(2251)-2'-O)-methyltransferase RlmB [Pacificispira spongiicola]NMM44708.1 23S rRNA (guanosine(2251)-2'-O)-methyltransferase RlmB [Pacificispira spongiicola]